MPFILNGCASTPDVKNGKSSATDVAAKEDTEQKGKKQVDFILGVGDSIDIAVYRHDDLKRSVKIDLSGKIMFPLIGDVPVAGRSVYQVRDEIQEKLARYIINPQVVINITAIQSQRAIVLGEVNNPGVFLLDTDMNTSEVIAKAGGMTSNASDSNVVLLRKESDKISLLSIDMERVLKKGDVSHDLVLKNGDIVYVPKAAIASASWLFSQLGQILSPFVTAESGIVLWPDVKDVLEGGKGTTSLSIPAR